MNCFKIKKLAKSIYKNSIDQYTEFTNKFIKCTGVHRVAGSRKTWVMEYVLIYAVSKGLTYILIYHMACRAI